MPPVSLPLECTGLITTEQARAAGIDVQAAKDVFYDVKGRRILGKKTKAYQTKKSVIKQALQMNMDNRIAWLRQFALEARTLFTS